jgi:hypothetical protein
MTKTKSDNWTKYWNKEKIASDSLPGFRGEKDTLKEKIL